MSYLVLARKWRPQTFQDVVAQRNAIQALQNAIRLKRLPHALLLCGSRGIGKTTIARLVAKTINCEARNPDADDPNDPAEPCNECSMCKEITEGRATDVIEIDGASNRSIDDIRELRDNVQYLPTRGRRKVYIIDEVHMLTREAFNALLKTLEEPPSHVLFTFATTEPHKIPITILSRCQRFDLKRITLSETCEYLGRLAEREGIQLTDTTLMMIARAADGGMRDALSLMDQVIAFGGEAPTDEEAAQAIGAIDRTMLHNIGTALLQRDIAAALQCVEELFSFAYDLRQLTQELASFLRDLMVAAVCPHPAEVIDLPATEIDAIKALAQGEAPDRIQQMFRILTSAAEDIAHASHPRLLLEMTLIQMARIEPVRPFDEVLQQLHLLEDRLASGIPEEPPGSGNGGNNGGNGSGMSGSGPGSSPPSQGHSSGHSASGASGMSSMSSANGMSAQPVASQPPRPQPTAPAPASSAAGGLQSHTTTPAPPAQPPASPQPSSPTPGAQSHSPASGIQGGVLAERFKAFQEGRSQTPKPNGITSPGQESKASSQPGNGIASSHLSPQTAAPSPAPTAPKTPAPQTPPPTSSFAATTSPPAKSAAAPTGQRPTTGQATPPATTTSAPATPIAPSKPSAAEAPTASAASAQTAPQAAPAALPPQTATYNGKDADDILGQKGVLSPDHWRDLVQKVKGSRRILSGPLETARYIATRPGEITLLYHHDQGMLHDTIKKPENTKLAEKLFAEQGTPLKLDIQIQSEHAAPLPNEEISLHERRQILHDMMIQRLKQEATAHPRMQQLLKLVPGTALLQIEPLAEEDNSTDNTD